MRDDLLTRHAVEQLELDPVDEDYFDRTWCAIESGERRALRTWRRLAVASALVALVAVGSAAAVLTRPQSAAARVVEATVSCAAQPRAGLHKITVNGGVAVPGRYPGDVSLWSVEKQAAGKIVSQIEFASTLDSVIVDRAVCKPSRAVVPLVPAGLPSNGVITPTFLGTFQDYCTLGSARVLVHYRVTLGPNGAVAGKLAIRADDKRHTPIAYIDWRPAKMPSFLSSRCTPPH
jgi:hypothetical protein